MYFISLSGLNLLLFLSLKKDAKAHLACFHEDFVFVRHATGSEQTLKDWSEDKITDWMNFVKVENWRCIYENDDILVVHAFNTYKSGDREALMQICMKKDGKVLKMETGATPLAKAEAA